jgi:hypothetical protein
MATITAKTGSGVPLNVLDPNTWVGGIVPTGSDYAIFPNQTIRTQFRSLAADNYIPYTPWTGFKSIEVASTTGFDASGSFYCFPSPMQDVLLPIKIDYRSRTATTFISCSIDQSFRQWLYQNSHSYTEAFPGDNPVAIGDLRYDDYLFKGYSGSLAASNQFTWQNQYILTGSGTWTVGRLDIGYGCDFTVNDTATFVLDTTSQTTNARISYTTNPQHGGMRILDSTTFHLTGSTNSATTTNLLGIYIPNNSNSYLIISGATNYSSSILTDNSPAGSNTITLQNAAAFSVGDYITIQTNPTIKRTASVVSGSNSDANNGILSKFYQTTGAGYYNYAFPTGSYFGPSFFNVIDTGSYETDEVVQIESITGNTAVVSKRFGLKGEIQQDLGLMDYKTFAETFGVSADYFTGTKRIVLIDSQHQAFTAGTNIIVSGSAYSIAYITTYLSQSSFIDFTNPATKWTDYVALDPYMYTGSGYLQSFGSSTPSNYIPRFLRYQTLTTASRAGQSSLYINTASLSTPASPLDTECITFLPIKDYFQDGEITISGSIVRDFTNTTSISNYLGVFIGTAPFVRHWANGISAQTVLSFNSYDGATGLMANNTDLYSKSKMANSTQGIAYGNRINLQNTASLNVYTRDGDLIFTSHTGSSQSVNMKIVWQNGIQQHYFQNTLVDEFLNPIEHPAMPSILLHRYASLFSINIKKRYQLAVLNTTNSVSKSDIVKEGGLFENQVVGKTCKFVANEIEDPMGMTNLLWDYYYKKGNTNILPYCHSYIAVTSGSFDSGLAASSIVGRSTMLQYSGVPSHWSTTTYGKSGADFYITYDVGTSISFDTIGVGFNYQGNGLENITNNTMSGIRIDVGDDPYTFTTVYAKQNDTRLSTLGNGIRFYTLPSGSVNKRFIRVFSDGGSVTTNFNSHQFFGVYSFQSASGYTPNTTNQIRLRSAQNFTVGDTIMFWNKEHQSGKRTHGNMWNGTAPNNVYINYDNITGVSTGITNDSGTVGGLTDYYTITAKSGNIITLDRTPAYEHLFKGTVVMKINRGKINFTGGRINRWIIYFVAAKANFDVRHAQFWSTSNSAYPGIQRFAGTTTYGDSIRCAIEDSFIYSQHRGNRNALAGSLIKQSNIICSKTQYLTGIPESSLTDRTAVAFNTFNMDTLAAATFPIQRFNKTVYTHNVELQSYRNNIITTSKGAGGANFPADNAMRRAGRWYIKNNLWQLFTYDPRIFTPGNTATSNLSNLIVQAHKQMVWENNWIDTSQATFVSSYDGGNVSTYGASIPMFVKCKVRNYREYVAAPNEFTKGYGTINTSQIPYLFSTTQYSFANGTGMPDNLQIRPDRDMFLRFTTRTNRIAMVFKENDHYSVWLDEAAGAVFGELANFLTCNFYVKETANIRIQLDLQARTTVSRKHAIDISQTSTLINQGYDYYGKKIPKVLVVDLENNIVLDQKLISSLQFADYSINKEFTLQPGNYAILLETGQDFSGTSNYGGAIRILDYKQPTLNILTSNLNNVDILFNNWDSYKMLNNIDNTATLDLVYTQNIGTTTVLQATADTSTTTRFNNVRI